MIDAKKLLFLGGLASCAVGMGGFLLTPPAKADTWDKKTVIKLEEPLIAGNVVLQPGTYVWKLLDSQSDRHVVQIFNKNENHIYTTILALPNYRLRPTGHTRFAFWETPDGVPKAVRAWFYPGDNFGQEFVYPKRLIAQLAAARPVPMPAEVQPAPEPAPAPQPEPAAQPEPAPAPQPEAEAAPEPAPAAPEAQPAPAPAPKEPAALPKTGSVFPLVGLMGLVSLSLAGLLSVAARRS